MGGRGKEEGQGLFAGPVVSRVEEGLVGSRPVWPTTGRKVTCLTPVPYGLLPILPFFSSWGVHRRCCRAGGLWSEACWC